ncbi:MAG TPA: competence protein CoiA family protein, partial [Ureibacillus sp.]|nr:competence protein CoiA family protein [Ureibacillus sp.]
EPYLPKVQQRPDLLITPDYHQQSAIEFQCSPISAEKLSERNNGYEHEKIQPIWIPQTPDKVVKKGIQKVSLSKNLQQFISASNHHIYIMTYNPNVRQFFYLSNLIYLHGNSFISKVQALPLTSQKFPFYIPKPVTKPEFKQFLLIYQQVKHNYLQARVLLSRSGVNDVLLRSAYELRMNLHALPNYIGIPIKGSEALNVFSIDWQIAVFYFVHTTQISIQQMKGQSIYYFLKWARLPETRSAYEAVFHYCRMLDALSIEHPYQAIQEENLITQIYTHFLAI